MRIYGLSGFAFHQGVRFMYHEMEEMEKVKDSPLMPAPVCGAYTSDFSFIINIHVIDNVSPFPLTLLI